MSAGRDLDDPDSENEATGPSEAGPIAYVGTILRWAPGSGTGVVRSASGRDIPFDLEHVIVLGELMAGPRSYALSNGLKVGFDLGWTSRGLRVTKLFPPP